MSGNEPTIVDWIAAIGALVTPILLVILSGVGWLIKNQLDKNREQERRQFEAGREDLASKYSTELELLRNELSERRELLNISLQAFTTSYSSAHERVLQAVDDLWAATLLIREATSRYLFVYVIFTAQELETASPQTIEKISQMIPNKSEADLMGETTGALEDIERKRPLVGESLWLKFFLYRAFSMRFALKAINQRKNKRFGAWDKDENGKPDSFIAQLTLIFDENELQNLLNQKYVATHHIQTAIELKMLKEMNELTFGKRFLDMSIEEQKRVTELFSQPQTNAANRS